MVQNKRKFKVGNTEYCVVRPSSEAKNAAQKLYNREFRTALDNGAYLAAALDEVMVAQHIWGEEKEKQAAEIIQKIRDGLNKLAGGGIKLSEAREVALSVGDARVELQRLLAKKNSSEQNTAEAQADNVRFNCYITYCTLTADGKRVFKDYSDFQQKSGDELTIMAAIELSKLLNDIDDNSDKQLPENQFLLKYKFVDENLRFINKNGHLIDRDGRLINEDGRYVDENGLFVDKDGNPVTEDGNPVIEFVEFEDDVYDDVVAESGPAELGADETTVELHSTCRHPLPMSPDKDGNVLTAPADPSNGGGIVPPYVHPNDKETEK